MAGQEGGQGCADQPIGIHGTADPHQALGLGRQPRHHLFDRFGFGQRRAGVAIDVLADVGDLEPAGRALQEPHAQLVLQGRHPPADPRLGQSQGPRSGREAPMGHDGRIVAEVVEIAHGSGLLAHGLFQE